MITQNGTNYYSLEEIRNYIESKDSLGDVHYFLNDKEVQKANSSCLEEEEFEDDTDN